LGEASWEKAESTLQEKAVTAAVSKSEKSVADMDFLFSGDLLNQCIASTFGVRDIGIPLVGLYGACSTMASAVLSSALFVDSGAGVNCAAVTSSHFCSAERQFRQPLPYGGQRTPTAQWTVTGAGSLVVSSEQISPIAVTAATVGIINDLGVTDATNMGAAMAPSAADTIKRFFTDTGTSADDFDVIMTGDLGYVGNELLVELLEREKIKVGSNLTDGGMLIFDRERQDVHAGGSGCGCSASVLCGYFLPRMMKGELKRMLFVGTGALMSQTSSFQGESIPGISHAVEFKYMQV
jgi:stage V sporulation protein AD